MVLSICQLTEKYTCTRRYKMNFVNSIKIFFLKSLPKNVSNNDKTEIESYIKILMSNRIIIR